jgi:hypothetical protein
MKKISPTQQLKNRCTTFIKQNLRAPPIPLVMKWGKTLKIKKTDIQAVSDGLQIRHQLGNLHKT